MLIRYVVPFCQKTLKVVTARVYLRRSAPFSKVLDTLDSYLNFLLRYVFTLHLLKIQGVFSAIFNFDFQHLLLYIQRHQKGDDTLLMMINCTTQKVQKISKRLENWVGIDFSLDKYSGSLTRLSIPFGYRQLHYLASKIFTLEIWCFAFVTSELKLTFFCLFLTHFHQ